jgi:hypothetical protein
MMSVSFFMAYRSFGRFWQASAPATIRRLLRPHHPFLAIARGLVPAEIVARLTTERPEVTGITLPGMPMNAPGMGGKSGTLKTYAFAGDDITVFSDE